ncbi:hypothetical protein [Micromonospora sp. NPDC092111]|uniref:hypothetical protein n=1 Tax=Micromonospora sp. NPDC092111 TaxID=3364289 RepID=UPI00381969DE
MTVQYSDSYDSATHHHAVLHLLKEALVLVFWYKKELRSFLTSVLQTRAERREDRWMEFIN